MHPDALIETAAKESGLDDFGGESYRVGLDVLVQSLNREAHLNDVGVAALESQIVGNLVNRLRVVDWARHHPEVDRSVSRPLFILGMPRTGTTLLSYLFHQDPARRSLLRWEALHAIPPPTDLEKDPRIQETLLASQMMDSVNPGFKAIHYEAPDGPTECVTLLSQDFKSLLWMTLANARSYGDWLLSCDQSSAYAYHRLELQVLQSETGGRWTLKSPHHSLALDEVVATYPDARFVMTHRDPVKVAASVCNLVESLSGTFTDADHRAFIGQWWPGVLSQAVDRVADFRAAHPHVPFVDVRYEDLVSDPVGTVERIYSEVGDPLSDDVRDRMASYATANPQGKHGRFVYSLDGFGIDQKELSTRFEHYRERFAVTKED